MTYPPLAPLAWLRWDLVGRRLREINPSTVIEVGAGQGAVGARLAARSTYLGYEPDLLSWRLAQGRLAGLTSAKVVNAPIPDDGPTASFDLLVAFEVLEHLEDDHGAMASWAPWIRPGGTVMVSVPAHPRRFGPGDVMAGHHRRYDRHRLTSVIAGAGLELVRIDCYGFPLGHATEWARARLASRAAAPSPEEGTRRSGRLYQPGALLGPIIRALVWPFRWAQRPFLRTDLGVGFVAVAQKPA